MLNESAPQFALAEAVNSAEMVLASSLGHDFTAGLLHKAIEIYSNHRGAPWVCPRFFWSERAIEVCDQNSGDIRVLRKELMHEHPVPTSIVLAELKRLRQVTEKRSLHSVLHALLQRGGIVCVVQKSENARLYKKFMPGIDGVWGDVWARYRSPKHQPYDQLDVSDKQPLWDRNKRFLGFARRPVSSFPYKTM